MKHVHSELIHAWADGAEVECQNIATGTWSAVNIPAWGKDAIYRIKDPYRHLKEAAADQTKQVRLIGQDWRDSGCDWDWAYPPDYYEIRDKPTKVKMWQWIYRTSDGDIYITARFHTDATCIAGSAVIGPALWTEIEIDLNF